MAKDLYKKEEKLGDYGQASVALQSDAKIVVKLEAQVDIVAELEKMAAATETKLDDTVVAYIKNLVAAANAVGI